MRFLTEFFCVINLKIDSMYYTNYKVVNYCHLLGTENNYYIIMGMVKIYLVHQMWYI